MSAIRPLADRDIQLMQLLKNRLQPQSTNQPIAPWDVARLEAKFKSDMYVPVCVTCGNERESSHLVFKSMLKNIRPTSHWAPVWMVWTWSSAVFSSTITRVAVLEWKIDEIFCTSVSPWINNRSLQVKLGIRRSWNFPLITRQKEQSAISIVIYSNGIPRLCRKLFSFFGFV